MIHAKRPPPRPKESPRINPKLVECLEDSEVFVGGVELPGFGGPVYGMEEDDAKLLGECVVDVVGEDKPVVGFESDS